jgi:hypothetical protein
VGFFSQLSNIADGICESDKLSSQEKSQGLEQLMMLAYLQGEIWQENVSHEPGCVVWGSPLHKNLQKQLMEEDKMLGIIISPAGITSFTVDEEESAKYAVMTPAERGDLVHEHNKQVLLLQEEAGELEGGGTLKRLASYEGGDERTSE